MEHQTSRTMWAALATAIALGSPLQGRATADAQSASLSPHRGRNPVAVLCPEGRISHRRKPLRESLRVRDNTIVAFYSDDSFDTLAVGRSNGRIVSASLCTGESLVVILSTRESGNGSHTRSARVANAAGGIIADVPGDFLDAVWSPYVPKLALIRGTRDVNGDLEPVGLIVWDARNRSTRTYAANPMQIGWYDSTIVLVDDWRTVQELDLNSGVLRHSEHHGVWISPDHRYSLRVSPEGSEELWDSVEKRDVTGRLLDALHLPRLTFEMYSPPFWVGIGYSHRLAIPIPGPGWGPRTAGEASGYSIKVMDVESGTIERTIPGKLLAPTPDRGGAVISIGNGIRNVRLPD